MIAKAYIVYPGDNPIDEGCQLVFAENRNQARQYGLRYWQADYVNMRANRRPEYDQWMPANAELPFAYETNEDLPEGCPAFYLEKEDYDDTV